MPERDDESFLLRWSRRKRGAEQDAPPEAGDNPEHTAAADVPASALDTEAPAAPADDEAAVPPELADVDIDALDYESDYTRFLNQGVPEALKRRALRQLWRSNPILANVDGLNDYDDDFSDAALVVDVLKTAHKVGRGYLDDDEDDTELGDAELADEELADAERADDGGSGEERDNDLRADDFATARDGRQDADTATATADDNLAGNSDRGPEGSKSG